jgi:DNA mismatch repair protein MutS
MSKKQSAVAFIDVSTGEFFVAEGGISYIDKLLQSFNPSEVIYPKHFEKDYQTLLQSVLQLQD